MEPTRLFDIMGQQAQHHPLPDALASKIGGKWQTLSSTQVLEMADALSHGLLDLGIRQGDRIALISMNRPEWAFVDLAALQIGAVIVPIYPSSTPTDYQYILAHAGARLAFISNQPILDKVNAARPELPGLEHVYAFDLLSGVPHISKLAERGQKVGSASALAAAKASVKADDLASLIYTSGTTGTPKGVMLTHANILSNVKAVGDIIPAAGYRRALSFLPLSHVFERTANYFYQHKGIAIYYAESIDTIAANLKEVQPDVMVTVPRLLEKIFDGIVAKGKALTGLKHRLFDWALKLGLAYDPEAGAGGPFASLQLELARKLIFSKWQEALGGRLKLIIVGGSALQVRLGRVFWAAGLTVIEGYGLTETSPVIACNSPAKHKLGTVGAVLPSVTVKIHQEEGYRPGEGEIIVKGPSVMQGYYKNPEATKEAIDSDGFFHTGDIGMLEQGTYLRITDRKKEMFKTSGGKYVAPLALENKFRESTYIGQVMVVGENRKFPSALIVPELKPLADWCASNGVAAGSAAEMCGQARVRELFSNEVERLNQGFGQWERIKQFRLVPDEWTIAAGELTPKLSLRRKVITFKHKDLIEAMYAGRGGGEA